MGRLVLLSVDGLRPDIYRAPERRHRFPNLSALEKSGTSAEAVETIYPSTTYPAHATIVTGLPPRSMAFTVTLLRSIPRKRLARGVGSHRC